MSKHIGVIGTRSRNKSDDLALVEAKVRELYQEGDWFVSGGCPLGGDRFAEIIAKKLGAPIIIFYPNWNKYGKSAGFKRNTSIASNSEVLIACVSDDRKGGTEDTIRKYLEDRGYRDETLHLV